MRSFIVNKFKLIFVFSLFALLFICTGLFCVNTKVVNASYTNYSADWFLPSSELEYVKLSQPNDAISFDDLSAVMTTNSLLVNYNDKSVTIDGSTFTEIERYKDSILISSESRLYKLDLADILSGNTIDFSSNEQLADIAISYFKTNGSYLVSSYTTYLRVFSINDLGVQEILYQNILADKSDVAINDYDIFFITSAGICSMKIQDVAQNKLEYTPVSSAKPKKMVADNNYLYYIDTDGSVCYLDITQKNPTQNKFTLDERDASFELGTLTDPYNISLRNGNLLITDGDTIQEFYIDHQTNTLSFTGFAIAKDKSAYNRVSVNATQIQKQNNTIGILDGDWLKIVDVNDNVYDRQNFVKSTNNISVQGFKPDDFALGQQSALLLYSQNKSTSNLRAVDFDGNLSLPITLPEDFSHIINDVAFQSGFYYVLSSNGSDTYVYRADEKTLAFERITAIPAHVYTQIAVDVYENIYIATNNQIDLLKKSNEFGLSTLRSDLTEIKKLQTDLNGGLFVQDGDAVYYSFANSLIKLEVDAPADKIKSFALDPFTKDVFFIYHNDEFVCKSNDLPNMTFSDLNVPSDFITTGNNANIQTLKVYTTQENANVYYVNKNDDGFSFNHFDKCLNNYLYICTIVHENGFESLSMLALAGKDSIVLIDVKQAVDVTEQTLNVRNAPQTAFITTDVNGYFLPLITVDSDYSLTDIVPVRLNKNTKISPISTLTFLDKDFYYANFTIGQTTYTGYIPTTFTVETLAQHFRWEDCTVKTVKKTNLFTDQTLTQIAIALDEDTQVRVVESYDVYTLVLVSDQNGGWISGYVKTADIKDPSGLAIKNVLIILIVATCVLGSTIYFIIRKKKIK